MGERKKMLPTLFIVAIMVGIAVGITQMRSSETTPKDVPMSQFMVLVETGTVVNVTREGSRVVGVGKDKARYTTVGDEPSLTMLVTMMREKKTSYTVKEQTLGFGDILLSMLPMILMLLLLLWLMRSMMGRQGSQFKAIVGNKAKLARNSRDVTFNDVAGIPEAVEQCRDIVDFLKAPEKFRKLGARIPKGVLLEGPPGNGKTLLARAVAGEAGVPFFSITGSDFVEMFVGVGASRVREMFEEARKNAPCILFIDEIDAVGRARSAGAHTGGHEEREQTLNQLLAEMDGFDNAAGVMVIAATNRADILDRALVRAGRFDRTVTVPMPDRVGRAAILKVHAKKVVLAPSVDLDLIARGTPGFNGAGLEQLLNEAALEAAKKDLPAITPVELDNAKMTILLGGKERKGIGMTAEELRTTAFHEAGHAILGHLERPATDEVHMVTIIPRGSALGVTVSLPEGDRFSMRRSNLIGKIRMALGGRAAEELIFGDVTTGAQSDLEHATAIARALVMHFGLSDELGLRNYSPRETFFGEVRQYSEATAERIDRAIDKILKEAYAHALLTLRTNRGLLDRLGEALLVHETLHREQLQAIFAGETLPAPGA